MSAQVLGRDADRLSTRHAFGTAEADAEAFDERRQLIAGIALARQRIVAARAMLARSHDIELRCVSAAQQVLVEERHETMRIVAAIAAEADNEVARLLGSNRHPTDRGSPYRRQCTARSASPTRS